MKRNLQLQVIKPGLHSTIQDLGRWDHLAFGVPGSGAMSQPDAAKANWLVGNPNSAPVLEITMVGPTLQLEGDGQIAFAGAKTDGTINGQPLAYLQTIDIEGSCTLKLGRTQDQSRAYMAIRGDWKLTPWLGSVSAAPVNAELLTPQSHLKEGMLWAVESMGVTEHREISEETVQDHKIRVMPGPEYQKMPIQTIRDFLTKEFLISNQSNRMGYRLVGKLARVQPQEEIISSGIVPGTIQVTNNSELIILMADAQTSGGYSRIANIITADICKVAQMKPGDPMHFSLVSLAEAQRARARSQF